MPKMTQNAVIFNKKIIISCITVIAAVLCVHSAHA